MPELKDQVRDAVGAALEETRADLTTKVLDQVRDLVRQMHDEEREERKAKEKEDANVERFKRIGRHYNQAVEEGHVPGLRLARVTRAMLSANGDTGRAMDLLRSWDRETADSVQRATNAGDPQQGGLLVGEHLVDEMIPLLRGHAVTPDLMPRYLPIPPGAGKIMIPRLGSGVTARWRPLDSSIKVSDKPTYGRLTLTPRALTALVVMPNILGKIASVSADQYVLQDTLQQFGIAIDTARLTGSGDEYEPAGYFHPDILGTLTQVSVAAMPDWKLPIKFLAAHLAAKGTMQNLHWEFPPILWMLLMTAESSAGNPVWLNEMKGGTLLGFPFHWNVNMTPGVDAHGLCKMVLQDANELLVAQLASDNGIEVAKTDVAAVPDESGTLYSLWAANESATKCVWRGDIGPRQPKAFTVSSNVWSIP